MSTSGQGDQESAPGAAQRTTILPPLSTLVRNEKAGDDETMTEAPAAAPAPLLTGQCPICGWLNERTAKNCGGCDWDLVRDGPPSMARFRRRTFDVRWIFVAIFAALMGGAGVGVLLIVQAGADERLVAQGRALLADGKPLEAEAAFREASELDRSNIEAWTELAMVLVAREAWEDARRVAEVIIGTRGDLFEPRHVLAKCLVELGQSPDLALSLFQTLLAERPETPSIYHDLARACEVAGHKADAIARYREALTREPDVPAAGMSHLRLALLLLPRANLADETYKHLAEAEKRGAPVYEVRVAQGDLAAQRSEPAAALQAYEAALAIRGDDPRVLARVARIKLDKLGDPTSALVSVTSALSVAPGDPELLKLRGRMLEALQRPEDAEVDYVSAVETNGEDAEALRLLASLEAKRGKIDPAREHIRRAIEVYARDKDTLLAAVNIFTLASDAPGRIDALGRLVDLTEDLQHRFQLAEALLDNPSPENEARAIIELKHVCQGDPLIEAPRVKLSQELLRMKRYDEAAQVLRDLVALRPTDMRLKVELARLYIDHTDPRRYDAAMALLDGVLNVDAKNDEARRLRQRAEKGRFNQGG